MIKIDFSQYLKQEDVIKYIVEYINLKVTSGFSTYGYDLYLPRVMERWLQENKNLLNLQNGETTEYYKPDISKYFYEASWELCRLGVLRPGIKKLGEQSTDDGSAGNGYSITPFGEQWLTESSKSIFISTEPGRFSEMLSPFSDIFGDGFKERSNQAIRCYGAHAYLACCVMCGASAESILLHLAIKKDGDEEKILKIYKTSNGRKKLEDLIISQQKDGIKNDFETFYSLLKYWRDESAHGRTTNISENEAYTSLALLLRCAQFSKDNYELLTGAKI